MVSLEDRNMYFKPYLENSRFVFFYEFIFFQKISTSFNPSLEFDANLKAVADSIVLNSKEEFIAAIAFFEQRQPNEDADYINDDILLFTLLCGFKKFSLDPKWVIECIELRSASNGEEKTKKQTFLNISHGNYESTDNNFGIIVVLETILSESLLSKRHKVNFYKNLVHLGFPPYSDAVLSLLAAKAYDIIITDFDVSDTGETIRLREFESRFKKSTNVLANIIYILVAIGILLLLWKLLSIPELKGFFEKVDTFAGIAGVSLSVWARKKIVPFFESMLQKAFGYK